MIDPVQLARLKAAVPNMTPEEAAEAEALLTALAATLPTSQLPADLRQRLIEGATRAVEAKGDKASADDLDADLLADLIAAMDARGATQLVLGDTRCPG
jgi:hypothetical protein